MKILAIANHKGGVGKTATTHALGAALAENGKRVLMVDIDSQSGLTGACGVESPSLSLANVIGGAQPGKTGMAKIIQELSSNLYLAPASPELSTSELGLAMRMGRENVIKKALVGLEDQYDICLIDCPPSLGLITVSALVAAHAVLIPTQPQIVDLRGLRLFLDTIEQVRQELNPGLHLLGILVTFYDARLSHHREAVAAMEGASLPVLPVRIGRSVRVAEAAGAGQSVITWESSNPQSENYRLLAKTVQAWSEGGASQAAAGVS